MRVLYRATNDLGGLTEQLCLALEPAQLPALVLWGEGDAYLPVRYAEQQKRYFEAQVHIMKNCGHWPMIDDPEATRAHVLPFLRNHVGSKI